MLRINAPSSLVNSDYDLVSPPFFAGGTPRFGGTASVPFREQRKRRKEPRILADFADSEKI
jgi:hypothetical protein